jgi:hypothetical protein
VPSDIDPVREKEILYQFKFALGSRFSLNIRQYLDNFFDVEMAIFIHDLTITPIGGFGKLAILAIFTSLAAYFLPAVRTGCQGIVMRPDKILNSLRL